MKIAEELKMNKKCLKWGNNEMNKTIMNLNKKLTGGSIIPSNFELTTQE